MIMINIYVYKQNQRENRIEILDTYSFIGQQAENNTYSYSAWTYE